jgi:hypothetical protein
MDIAGYHVLSTRRRNASGDFTMTQAEWLTGLISALTFQKHTGPMALITDSEGLSFALGTKLDKVYQAGIRMDLDNFRHINTSIFWAGAKVLCHQLMPLGAVSLDFDCILWKPITSLRNPVVALNREPTDWNSYSNNQAQFSKYGFSRWDWQALPVNAGVVKFNDQTLKSVYITATEMFMETFSNDSTADKASRDSAMMFVEQRLMSMCASKLGMSVGTIAKLFEAFIERSRVVSHMWGSKPFYTMCPRAEAHYINYLLELLTVQFPDFISILTDKFVKKNLDDIPVGMHAHYRPQTPFGSQSSPISSNGRFTYFALEETEEGLQILDPTIFTGYPAKVGDCVFNPRLLFSAKGSKVKTVCGPLGNCSLFLEPA